MVPRDKSPFPELLPHSLTRMYTQIIPLNNPSVQTSEELHITEHSSSSSKRDAQYYCGAKRLSQTTDTHVLYNDPPPD